VSPTAWKSGGSEPTRRFVTHFGMRLRTLKTNGHAAPKTPAPKAPALDATPSPDKKPAQGKAYRESAIGPKRTLASALHMSAFRGKADIDFSDIRKRFSYFLLGRLRFCDDVACRRFAHLVSDGLPLK
jgi:hypothetical protein